MVGCIWDMPIRPSSGARRAAAGGQFLRIEDIDIGRARPHFVEGIYQDLEWLGLSWPEPVMVQSTRFEIYQTALDALRAQGLVYPCWATRREILAAIQNKKDWPRDPDGAPLYLACIAICPTAAKS